MAKKRVLKKIQLLVNIFKSGQVFVAYAPQLDLSTQGTTLEEAQKSLTEIVELFFEEIEDMGTTDEVLASLGWIKRARKPATIGKRSISIPWSPPAAISHSVENFCFA